MLTYKFISKITKDNTQTFSPVTIYGYTVTQNWSENVIGSWSKHIRVKKKPLERYGIPWECVKKKTYKERV